MTALVARRCWLLLLLVIASGGTGTAASPPSQPNRHDVLPFALQWRVRVLRSIAAQARIPCAGPAQAPSRVKTPASGCKAHAGAVGMALPRFTLYEFMSLQL